METINYSENPKILPSLSTSCCEVSTGSDITTAEKKPITKELKSLVIGGSATFPMERRSSVIATAQRLKKDLIRVGWNFKLIENTEDFTVTVVRVPL